MGDSCLGSSGSCWYGSGFLSNIIQQGNRPIDSQSCSSSQRDATTTSASFEEHSHVSPLGPGGKKGFISLGKII